MKQRIVVSALSIFSGRDDPQNMAAAACGLIAPESEQMPRDDADRQGI
jgi:hypothetical protein